MQATPTSSDRRNGRWPRRSSRRGSPWWDLQFHVGKVSYYYLALAAAAAADIVDPATGEVLVKANRKFTKAAIRKMEEHGIKTIPIGPDDLGGRIASNDVVDPATGEIIVECNEEITASKLAEIKTRGIADLKVLFIDNLHVTSSFRDTILIDKISNDTVGAGLLDFALPDCRLVLVGDGEMEAALRAFYDKWGVWFIFLKGLTPIPYKLVTIISGAMHFSLPIFILASAIR